MDDERAPARKAANGEDSIYWDASKNRYIGAVSLGFTPAGKRKRLKVSGKTKTEVRNKIRKLRSELAADGKAPANYTVGQAVNEWLAKGLRGRDESSLALYGSLAKNHVVPQLGHAKLQELEADTVDDWLVGRAEVLGDEGLKKVRSILKRSIDHARRRGRANRNVVELVDLPEGRPGKPSNSLSMTEAESVLRAREGTWIHAYVVLALLVGVRTEEERPLTWAHVHTEAQGDAKPYIDVWRSVRRRGETKTVQSRRSLAMPLQVAEVMRDYRSRQQEQFRAAGKVWSAEGLVFPDDHEKQRTSTNVLRNFRSLLRDAGVKSPEKWTVRMLRTSCVSLLSAHGIPIEAIALVVGHSGTHTTERVYRKQLQPVIRHGAQAMDEIFGSGRTLLSADVED
ncbi:tyrosine-type recombinase/integrase [Streptomyces sp. NBC_01232]|uniref:site-specific integrase n=1 Tax=Streptomyces sp. NBC_01232 TaxID=2903786 RepID=UPI002E12D835|nr:tyrosine-type recombinase/integrase [Streptomyces sp. NBC_01232]